MLWTICLCLVVIWLVGVVSAFTLGGFLHVLLLAALCIVVFRVISDGRQPIA